MSLPARNHSQSLGRTHPSLPEPRRCAGSSPGCDQQLPERPVGGRIHQDMRSSPGSTGGSGRSCCQPRSRARSALPVLCRGRPRIKPPPNRAGERQERPRKSPREAPLWFHHRETTQKWERRSGCGRSHPREKGERHPCCLPAGRNPGSAPRGAPA